MAGLRVHFVMSRELVERIDAALVDGQSRGEFVRRAVEAALDGRSAGYWYHEGWREARGESGEPGAVEQALSEAQEPPTGKQADPGSVPQEPVGSPWGVRSAAPAERPVFPPPVGGLAPRPPEMSESERSGFRNLTGAPSSSQAKRDVRPVPKGGK